MSTSKESQRPTWMDTTTCCWGFFLYGPQHKPQVRSSPSGTKGKKRDVSTGSVSESAVRSVPAVPLFSSASGLAVPSQKVHSKDNLQPLDNKTPPTSPPTPLLNVQPGLLEPAAPLSVQAAHVCAQVPSRYLAERQFDASPVDKGQYKSDATPASAFSPSSSSASYTAVGASSRFHFPMEAAVVSASSSSLSPTYRARPVTSVTWFDPRSGPPEEVSSKYLERQVDVIESKPEYDGYIPTPRSSYAGSDPGTDPDGHSPRRYEDRDALAASLGAGSHYKPWDLAPEPVIPRQAAPNRTPRTPRTPGREGDMGGMCGEGWETCSTSIGGSDDLMERYFDLGPREPGLQPTNQADLLTTLLPDAIQAHDDERLKEYLRSGADPNNTAVGDLPLMLAINTGRLSAVQALLDAKADVNLRDSSGNVVLVEAVYLQDRDIIQALIAAGADPDLEDCDGTRASDMLDSLDM